MRHEILKFRLALIGVATAAAVACQLDKPVGYTHVKQPLAAVVGGNLYTFKIDTKDGWKCMVAPGDSIQYDAATGVGGVGAGDNGFYYRLASSSAHATGHSTDSTYVLVDTLPSPIADTVQYKLAWGGSLEVGNSSFTFSYKGNTGTFVNPAAATIKFDSIVAGHNWFSYRGGSSVRADSISADAVGAVKFDAPANTPACAIPAPTNVTLANAGPYPKITWANTSDTVDSTEVWFGINGRETKQGVFSTSITSYFGTWSGGGIYDAYVFHRFNGIVSTTVYSNSLSH